MGGAKPDLKKQKSKVIDSVAVDKVSAISTNLKEDNESFKQRLKEVF